MTTVSRTQAILLFGKDGPGTVGDSILDASRSHILTLGSPASQAVEMRWDALHPQHQQGSAAPPARWGHSATLIAEDLILVFGGFGEEDVMNDVWLLQFELQLVSAQAAQQPGRHMQDSPSDVKMTGSRWVTPQIDGDPPPPRSFHSVTLVPGVGAVVFGGLSRNGCALSDLFVLEVFAPSATASPGRPKLRWGKIPNLPACRWPRAGHVAVLHDGVIFFAGGQT
jgi:hypothetical protein